MWESVIASGIAVLGTLAGSVTTHMTQLRGARAQRREARAEEHRKEALAAVTGLVAALADHRRAMWEFADAKLKGRPQQMVMDLQAVQHGTRGAINVPMTTVAILAPELADTARRAAQATYDMRNAEDLDVLDERRRAALAATDEFVAAAARFFNGLGVVVA